MKCRHQLNNYFSEIHTKGQTVVALDLQSLKELAKHNHLENNLNGSSQNCGPLKANHQPSHGDIQKDYLPDTCHSNGSSTHDLISHMNELQNCVLTIKESLSLTKPLQKQ